MLATKKSRLVIAYSCYLWFIILLLWQQDGEVEAKIDKDTGNEYSYVTVKGGGASINPYATLTSDGMVRKF